MSGHIVNYDENSDGTRSRAKCSCGDSGPWHYAPATETWAMLDAWAELHIEGKA